MDIDFYEHRFTRAQLIEITGVPKLTLQNWLHRNTISVTPKQKGGTGNRRLFSAFDKAVQGRHKGQGTCNTGMG